MPYTMFASAVFCPESPHPDALVELDPIHSYRCERGLWTCTRVFGTREKNARLGSIMRACDRMLRDEIEDVCVALAKHDDRRTVDALVELGYLNADNLYCVIDRVGAVQDAAMTNYLLEIKRERFGQTFVIVTHDESLAAMSDRTIHMVDGRISG